MSGRSVSTVEWPVTGKEDRSVLLGQDCLREVAAAEFEYADDAAKKIKVGKDYN